MLFMIGVVCAGAGPKGLVRLQQVACQQESRSQTAVVP